MTHACLNTKKYIKNTGIPHAWTTQKIVRQLPYKSKALDRQMKVSKAPIWLTSVIVDEQGSSWYPPLTFIKEHLPNLDNAILALPWFTRNRKSSALGSGPTQGTSHTRWFITWGARTEMQSDVIRYQQTVFLIILSIWHVRWVLQVEYFTYNH